MELRQLRTFRKVVERGSFARAAEELRYAQSTVTLHIKQLERDYGVELFERSGRATKLTEAGGVLAEQAKAVLGRAEGLEQAMADFSAGDFGHVRVGCIEPTASLRLPKIVAEYCEEHPKVRLTVTVDGTRSIAARLGSGELDVGVCSPLHTYEGLHFEPLFVEQMALLVPEKSPLAEVDALGAKDLEEHKLLLSEGSCAYRAEMEKVLVGLGANASVDVEVGHAEMGSVAILGEAVRRGIGIAALPRAGITPPPQGTTIKDLRGVELGLTVGILMSSDRAAPGRALERFLRATRWSLAQPSR